MFENIHLYFCRLCLNKEMEEDWNICEPNSKLFVGGEGMLRKQKENVKLKIK